MIRKGSYILVIETDDLDVRIGSLGDVHLDKGSYCYVGSAMNGLDQRVSRHLAASKKIHWHIDHLTTAAASVTAYESAEGESECELGKRILGMGAVPSLQGFGCSDCRCRTHLFSLDGPTLEALSYDPAFKRYQHRA